MDEFLDEMDDEQVDDLLQPEEGEDKAPQRQTGEKQLPGETGGCCDNYDDTTSADFRDSP